MQNIVADNNVNWIGFDFDGRTLLIKSYDTDKRTDKYTINFKGNHPNLRGNTSLDLTYENVNIWSADYYGIARAYDLMGDNYANITLKFLIFTVLRWYIPTKIRIFSLSAITLQKQLRHHMMLIGLSILIKPAIIPIYW